MCFVFLCVSETRPIQIHVPFQGELREQLFRFPSSGGAQVLPGVPAHGETDQQERVAETTEVAAM